MDYSRHINSKLPINKKLVISLLQTINEVSSKMNSALKPYGISEPQFNVLRILRGQKGNPISLAEVQEQMITKMSNTTRLIDKLEAKNCVRRVINTENKRKIDLTITNVGLDLLKRTDDILTTTENELVAGLTTNEKAELTALLRKLRLIAK
ncbi:MarR family winged helix-turn-helix transcriptional regulator [Algibacter lectus]|uniref:MarR family winged helix-turn-helix transcriptional regulator n=1 Tax=Algibacter lectus TaxID=221126 RepID=UPI0024946038|nr:MarR family transcriptional regulator [Algibacter lectus]